MPTQQRKAAVGLNNTTQEAAATRLEKSANQIKWPMPSPPLPILPRERAIASVKTCKAIMASATISAPRYGEQACKRWERNDQSQQMPTSNDAHAIIDGKAPPSTAMIPSHV